MRPKSWSLNPDDRRAGPASRPGSGTRPSRQVSPTDRERQEERNLFPSLRWFVAALARRGGATRVACIQLGSAIGAGCVAACAVSERRRHWVRDRRDCAGSRRSAGRRCRCGLGRSRCRNRRRGRRGRSRGRSRGCSGRRACRCDRRRTCRCNCRSTCRRGRWRRGGRYSRRGGWGLSRRRSCWRRCSCRRTRGRRERDRNQRDAQ